jgi:hypothetical protein
MSSMVNPPGVSHPNQGHAHPQPIGRARSADQLDEQPDQDRQRGQLEQGGDSQIPFHAAPPCNSEDSDYLECLAQRAPGPEAKDLAEPILSAPGATIRP